MKGTIKTYLPEKKYGFIKGDDGKDYFFHESEFSNSAHKANICEDAYVNFEQVATPKGYKAKCCLLENSSDVLTYVVPNEVYISKSSDIKGWDTLELGEWLIEVSSTDSPDAAKKEAVRRAEQLGANAILNLEYFKTTGSNGNYQFSVHNYRGRVATIAKRNSKGPHSVEQLTGLNERAEVLKTKLFEQSQSSRNGKRMTWTFMIILSLVSFFAGALAGGAGLGFFAFLACLIVGSIIAKEIDYDGWLVRDPLG